MTRELPLPSFPQEGWEGPKNSLGSPCCMLCLPRGSPKPEADVLGTGARQDWGSWCRVLCPAGAGQALLIRGNGMHRLQGMSGGRASCTPSADSHCFPPSRVFCKSDAIPPRYTHTHESACWPLPGETCFFQADGHEGRMKSAPCPPEGQ